MTTWAATAQGLDARRRTSSPSLGQLRIYAVHRPSTSQVTAGRLRGALAGRVRHVDMSKPGRNPGEGNGKGVKLLQYGYIYSDIIASAGICK